MKHVQSFAAAFLALIIIGCGGSSSSSTTGTATSGTSNLSNPRIEAIVRVETTNLMHPTEWTDAQLEDPLNLSVKADLINPTVFGFQDPTNFQAGERYFFQLAAYTPSGGRVILPATFQSLDLSGTYGNLGTNSGAFDASNNATTTAQTILATYNGLTFQAAYDVKQREARVLGQVELQTSNAPEPGATLDFYDVDGRLVGTVTSSVDGTFRASIPIAATTFTIDPHTLNTAANNPTPVYNVFAFGGPIFGAGDPECTAPLPGLSIGTISLSSPIFVVPSTAGVSQPATSGCPASS